MPSVTDEQKRAIGDLWAHNVTAHPAPAAHAAAIDPKQEFCKDWPIAKQVLQALQTVVPQPGPILIGLVIAAGDAAHSTVCK